MTTPMKGRQTQTMEPLMYTHLIHSHVSVSQQLIRQIISCCKTTPALVRYLTNPQTEHSCSLTCKLPVLAAGGKTAEGKKTVIVF